MLKAIEVRDKESIKSDSSVSDSNTNESFEALLLFGLKGENTFESKEAAYVIHMLKHVCGIDVETLADGVVSLRLPKPTKLHS